MSQDTMVAEAPAQAAAQPSLPLTVPALFAERRRDSAERLAIVDEESRLTYAELDRRSAELAAELVRRGVNKVHRVGLLAPNGADWAVIAYALMRIGAVPVLLSTLLRPPELKRQLEIAGVRHLIAAEAYRGRDYQADVAQIDRAELPSLANIWWWGELKGVSDGDLAMVKALEARVRPADDMVVIFTSGSRGAPKGVIHTHGNAIRAARAALEPRRIDRDTRLYVPMPFFWTGGIATGLLPSLIAGATLITENTAEPARTLKLLEQEKVTHYRGWPDQAVQLAAHPDFAGADLSNLHGASLQALLPAAKQGPPGSRATMLGMTETFGPYTGWPLDQDLPKASFGAAGKPLGDTKVRIADPATGEILATGETGSIQVGGPNILRGMCGREREEVFTRDGWYDTGDLGRIDADGFVYFAGRRDDMFKVKGASVYPTEVEEALQALPGVRRAFASEVTIDGASAVGAAVLPEEGASLDAASLTQALKATLSSFKAPSRWLVLKSLDELPMLPTGKLDKAAFRALLERS